MKLNNKYYILRHGQAISNVKDIVSCWPEKIRNPLTRRGKEMIKESAKKLLDKKIDLIFASPLLRTNQTAEIIGKALKIKPKLDKRLREMGFGIFNGGLGEKMWKHFKGEEERIKKGPSKGESYSEILKRVMSFLKDINKKYKGKNILIVSHEGPLFLLQGKLEGLSFKETIKKYPFEKRIHKGEIRELN
jgi:broad specificity phosphatase PhoE